MFEADLAVMSSLLIEQAASLTDRARLFAAEISAAAKPALAAAAFDAASLLASGVDWSATLIVESPMLAPSIAAHTSEARSASTSTRANPVVWPPRLRCRRTSRTSQCWKALRTSSSVAAGGRSRTMSSMLGACAA